MRGLILGIVLAASSVSVPGMARADDAPQLNVQSLCQDCTASDEDFHKVNCIGTLAGIGASLTNNGYLLKYLTKSDAVLMSKFSICGQETLGAEIQAFVNWAQKHPERWNDHFSFGVTQALRETWPCSAPYK